MEWVTVYVDKLNENCVKITDRYYSTYKITVFLIDNFNFIKEISRVRENDHFPYVVSYVLDEEGKYRAVLGASGMCIVDPETGYFLVHTCFLPVEWDGRRVTRVEEESGEGVKR